MTNSCLPYYLSSIVWLLLLSVINTHTSGQLLAETYQLISQLPPGFPGIRAGEKSGLCYCNIDIKFINCDQQPVIVRELFDRLKNFATGIVAKDFAGKILFAVSLSLILLLVKMCAEWYKTDQRTHITKQHIHISRLELLDLTHHQSVIMMMQI